jgi:hypothetical protein
VYVCVHGFVCSHVRTCAYVNVDVCAFVHTSIANLLSVWLPACPSPVSWTACSACTSTLFEWLLVCTQDVA